MFVWSWREGGVYTGPFSSDEKGDRKVRPEELKVIQQEQRDERRVG